MYSKYRDKMLTGFLNYTIKNHTHLFDRIVNQRVAVVSAEALVRRFNEEGILHCNICGLRAMLIKHEGKYVCKKHYQELINTERLAELNKS